MMMQTHSASPDLSGKTAFVAGGTGSVGRVVVREFLAAGATVVVPSRSASKLERLREHLVDYPAERLIVKEGSLSDEEDAVRIRNEVLDRTGPLDAVVSTLGHFVPAPSVLEAPLSSLEAAVEGYLLAHFMVAKTMMPALEEKSGSYTFINGPLAFQPMFPGAGLVSVVTAAQAMLARTIMSEQDGGPVRVNELVIYTRFAEGDPTDGNGPVSQAEVGRYLVHLAAEQGVRGETIHLNDPDVLASMEAVS